ncbi:MAG TPA: DSD1 family PLP-dependent enzyme [Methylomirabilota bacterium]|jgi:D-serine deaminase-like pyridoxal phosphate-dependent protein
MTQGTAVGRPVNELDTPALLVDLAKLERNIATMRRVIVTEAGVNWRPHTKAIKIPALARKLLDAGARGVTCAKLGEAEVLAADGVRDVLIANQVVGAEKMARLAALRRQADPIVAVDSEAHVAALAGAGRLAGAPIRVVVEVNIAMNRAGVEPGEPVVALARRVGARGELRFAGLMGWEGGRLASIADPVEKRRAIEAAVGLLTASADACRAAGLPVEIVSCGGTGTYWISARLPGVTEVQAGGGIFGDVHYLQDYGVKHEQALTILTTVASRPSPTRIVCDAGWKSMAVHPTLPAPLGVGEVRRLNVSAEHATIELAAPSARPEVGDHVEFVAGYCDSTLFLHDELHGIRDGRVEAVWPILGRGKTR